MPYTEKKMQDLKMRSFLLFLYHDLQFKKDVYEQSMLLAKKNLPPNYIERLKYEQEEIVIMLKRLFDKESETFLPKDGLWHKRDKVLITEDNMHIHWHLVQEAIYPQSALTWMEFIFGPIFPLFRYQELNDFIMEWTGIEREQIVHLFLNNSERWNLWWMTYYRDVVQNPDDYEEVYHFPILPKKKPLCLGHIAGCNNRSEHFCQECQLKWQ